MISLVHDGLTLHEQSDENVLVFYLEDILSGDWKHIPSGPLRRLKKYGFVLQFRRNHQVYFLLSEHAKQLLSTANITLPEMTVESILNPKKNNTNL